MACSWIFSVPKVKRKKGCPAVLDYVQKKTPEGRDTVTSNSASFYVRATDFWAENLTFENVAVPVGQALAIWTGGDRVQFRNCRFLGNQDSIYTDGRRQYFDHCHIKGTTDYIFVNSTA